MPQHVGAFYASFFVKALISRPSSKKLDKPPTISRDDNLDTVKTECGGFRDNWVEFEV